VANTDMSLARTDTLNPFSQAPVLEYAGYEAFFGSVSDLNSVWTAKNWTLASQIH
jgi:hypothetical protein